MDTKSRVALFVGGVVLVGLVAYVLMPSRKPAENNLADSSAQTSGESADQLAAAPPATQPTTRPVAIADPFAAPPTTQPSATPAVAIGPSLPPADTTDAWARALDGNTSSASVGGPNTTSLNSPLAHGVAPSGNTYKVAAGDSLYTISEKLFGNGKYVSRLLAANPGLNPKRLKVGQEINVPDLNADAATPTIVPATTGSSAHAASDKTYKVQAGDTLRKIAAKMYGNATMWEKLYSANKSLIGSDPSHLKAGMVLQLPEAH